MANRIVFVVNAFQMNGIQKQTICLVTILHSKNCLVAHETDVRLCLVGRNFTDRHKSKVHLENLKSRAPPSKKSVETVDTVESVQDCARVPSSLPNYHSLLSFIGTQNIRLSYKVTPTTLGRREILSWHWLKKLAHFTRLIWLSEHSLKLLAGSAIWSRWWWLPFGIQLHLWLNKASAKLETNIFQSLSKCISKCGTKFSK